ncbi:hypothetical protein I7I51_08180 [Histoplasma capsulatum]|uniref:Uncharacterized protein n=1 Tax=Ajellomyces capsulatus TaxID=5037 RepID=A0A8A1LYC5_AJECA|nr:hypothetical protein I7I51_08180 [Histoplasma capsulatum]
MAVANSESMRILVVKYLLARQVNVCRNKMLFFQYEFLRSILRHGTGNRFQISAQEPGILWLGKLISCSNSSNSSNSKEQQRASGRLVLAPKNTPQGKGCPGK